ncbi:MAG: hypothetical protein WCR38_06320, partial [Bacteroidales bacterium]
MKKRILLVFLIVVLMAIPLFAANNGQKIRSMNDETYEAISYLYVNKGLAQPSLTAPYSDNELSLMLKKIQNMNFTESEKKILNYVKSNLNEKLDYEGEGISYNWDFNFAIESFIHNNTTDFQSRDVWNYDKINHKPFIDINFETFVGDNMYGFGDFSVGLVETLANKFGSSVLTTNIPMVPPSIMSDLDFNMPYRAFVAAGGDYWSFEVGRDRLSWGGGVTGNLTVSDNLLYHNLARITTFGDKYKYTFVTSFFPHPSMYIDMHYHDDDDDPETPEVPFYDYNPLEGLAQDGDQNGINMYMAHRLEWRLFKDRMNITLTESIMYQSLTNALDLRVLSPAAIFHDYYIRANANSLLGLEFDITPIKGLNIYAQVVVDEFLLPGEVSNPATSHLPPAAHGILVGAKANMNIAGYPGHLGFEFAKTDPFLYLRDNGERDQIAGEYGISYVVTIREFTNNSGTLYHPEFLGYNYGGDAIVLN